MPGLPDVQIVADLAVPLERPGRAGRPSRRATGSRKFGNSMFGPSCGSLIVLGRVHVRQLAALQDEHAVRALGEHALPRAPGPLLVAGQARERFRPVRHDLVRAENVLTALLARDGREPRFLPVLRRDAAECRHGRRHHRHGHKNRESPSTWTHVSPPGKPEGLHCFSRPEGLHYFYSEPRYAAIARMSSSVRRATGFFISWASMPFRVPSLKR